MKVEVEEISAVEKRVEIEIPAERVNDEIEEQYRELKSTAQVKGFRKGKAPRKILVRLFKDYIHEAVMKKLVEETLDTALARKNIEPVVEPVLDPSELRPDQAYSYTVHVEVKPEIEVADYQGIEITHQPRAVTDEDVEEVVERMRETAALIREPDPARPLTGEDQVTVELSIKDGEEELIAAGENEQVIELWRESWIPGLVEILAGHSAGDTVTFSAEIEDNQNVPEKFRSKNLAFTFTIKVIKERVLPELDDDFVKEYTRHQSVEEFRTSIREGLEERTGKQNRDSLEYAILEELAAKNQFPVPPSLKKQEARRMAKNFLARQARREVADAEAEQFESIFLEEAEKGIRANYLLEAVARQESLEAGDEEIEERIKQEAEKAGMHPDKYKDRLGEHGVEYARRQIVLDKALDFLVLHANIKEEADKEEG